MLLHGPNHFLAAEYTAALRDKLESKGPVDLLHFDGKEHRVADVLDECRSTGLMMQHKLVVVDHADDLVKLENRPLVERYVQPPAADATLVLRASKWNKGKLDEMIASVGIAIECGEVSEESAARWIPARAEKRHAATIEPKAAQLLLERCGPDLGRLDSELSKLAAAAMGDPSAGGVITLALVRDMVGKSREESAWDWQSVLLQGHAGASLARLRDLLDISREPAQLMWYAALDLSRKLQIAAGALKAGDNPEAVARALRLWGPSKGAILGLARAVGPAAAHRALTAAVEGDQRSKSGLGDAERNLERLTVSLSGMIAAARDQAR